MHRSGGVDGVDARAGLLDDAHDVVDAGQRAVLVTGEPLLCGLPVDELHREVRSLPVLAIGVDCKYIAMREARHGACFFREEIVHLRHRHHR